MDSFDLSERGGSPTPDLTPASGGDDPSPPGEREPVEAEIAEVEIAELDAEELEAAELDARDDAGERPAQPATLAGKTPPGPPPAGPGPPPRIVSPPSPDRASTAGALPDVSAADVLEELVEETGQARRDVYRRELALEHDPEQQAMLAFALAEALAQPGLAADEEAAIAFYRQAIAADPKLQPAAWALERSYTARGAFADVVQIIDGELAVAEDDRRRAALLTERGVLLLDHLEDVSAARQAFEQALALVPELQPALMALEKITLQSGDEAALETLYRRAAAATHDLGRRSALLVDLAHLAERAASHSEANAPAEAVSRALALLHEACALGASGDTNVAMADVIDELEQLAARHGRIDDVKAALELQARWLEARLDQRAGSAAAGEPLAQRLAAVRRRQAQLFRADGALANAFDLLMQARQRLPGDVLLLADLADLAHHLGRHDVLAEVLAEQAVFAPAPFVPHLLAEQAIALCAAGRQADAARLEAELAQRDTGPGFAAWLLVMARTERALAAGDLAALAEARRAEAALGLASYADSADTETAEGRTRSSDPRWAAAALTQAATLAERLGREDEAEATWRHALEIAPDYRPALEALDRRYLRSGNHEDRARLLQAALERAPDAAQPETDAAQRGWLLAELVEIYAHHGALDRAVACAESLLELRPHDVATLDRLAELSVEAGQWPHAVKHLDALADALFQRGATDAAAATVLLGAEVLEHKLGVPIEAAQRLEAAANQSASEASGRTLWMEAKRIYGAQQRPQDTVRVLQELIATATTPALVAALGVELGEIYEQALGDRDQAAQAYRDAAQACPDYAPAGAALARVTRALGDAEGLKAALAAQAQATTTPSGRALAWLELGEAAEILGPSKAGEAESAYRQSLAAQVSAHALYGRWRVQARRRDFGGLDETLTALKEMMRPEAAALADAARIRLWVDPPQPQHPVGPAMTPTQSALRWARWISVARAGPPRERILALGDLTETTDDPRLASALALHAAVVARVAGEADAIDAQAVRRRVLAADQAQASGEAQMLRVLGEVSGDPEGLALRIGHGQRTEERVERRLERVTALIRRGRLDEAGAEAMEALAEAPRHPGVLLQVLELARRGGDRRSEARTLAHLAETMVYGERAAALYQTAAEIFEALGDTADAALAWSAVLARRPADGNAFARALSQLRAYGDPEAHIALLGHGLEHQVGGRAAELLLERADLQRRAGRLPQALADARAACALERDNISAVMALAELLAASGERAEALRCFDHVIDVSGDSDELRRARIQAAMLLQASGEPEQAVTTLKRGLVLVPDDRELIERLSELYLLQGDGSSAVLQLRALIGLGREPAERIRIERRLATIYLNHLHDPRGAIEAMTHALELDPLAFDLLTQLVPLAKAHGEHQLSGSLLKAAASAARARIAQDAADPEPFRQLAQACMLAQDHDLHAIAIECAALAAKEPPLSRTPPSDPTQPLSDLSWNRLLTPQGAGAALAVWRETSDAALSVLEAEPVGQALYLQRGPRLNERALAAGWEEIDRRVRLLTGQDYALYATQGAPELGQTVGAMLILGARFADAAMPGALRFGLAYNIALLRERLGMIELLDDEALELHFAAAARLAGTTWAPLVSSLTEARIEERSRQLGKLLDRRARKALQTLAPRFGELGDVRLWRQAVLVGARKLALAATTEVAPALHALGFDFFSEPGRALVCFAVSEEMAAVRDELGLRA